LQSTGRHAGAAARAVAGQEIGNGAGECPRLVEVGNVPSAGKLEVARAGQRLVELAHGRCSGVFLANQKQNRPRHRCNRRGIIVVGERRGTPDEALHRRGADHLAHLVDVRRIGFHHFGRKPARDRGLDQRLHALLLRDDDALVPLLAARQGRLARRIADDDLLQPLRVLQRQAERGGATHGEPREMCRLDCKRIHQRQRIRDQLFERVAAAACLGSAVAALIISEHAEATAELTCLLIPHAQIGRE